MLLILDQGPSIIRFVKTTCRESPVFFCCIGEKISRPPLRKKKKKEGENLVNNWNVAIFMRLKGPFTVHL